MMKMNPFPLLINWLIPSNCPGCRASSCHPHELCADCWKGVDLITDPCCHLCGYPFDASAPETTMATPLCDRCYDRRPHYDQVRSAAQYGGAIKRMILQFKHVDATELAPFFARLLYGAGVDLFPSADYLVPVPLHWTRLMGRLYNQASTLAQCLSNRYDEAPPFASLIRRMRKTQSQGRKNHQERHDNIKGAFYVPKKYHSMLKDKVVILVDDVMTSGATLDECALVLKQAGCREVRALTIARVPLKN